MPRKSSSDTSPMTVVITLRLASRLAGRPCLWGRADPWLRRRAHTTHNASVTMRRFILDVPTRRSSKTMGTSTM